MADIVAWFVVLMASIYHQEAEKRQFLSISTIWSHLPKTKMPESSDLAIFVLADNRQTQPIILPLVHARGVNIGLEKQAVIGEFDDCVWAYMLKIYQ